MKTLLLRGAVALALFWGAASQAELFVSSFSGNRVLRFNETNGNFQSVFVATGSGGLDLPHGLAFGPDGNLYVASAGNDSVLRFNGTNGAFLGAFVTNGAGGLDYPVELLFRDDGFLYVSSQISDSVLRFHSGNGAPAGAFVASGSGGLDGPSGMVFGPDGHLYVVGRYGNQLLRFDGTNGAFLNALSAGGAGGLSQPFGVKCGPDGRLYVVSGNNNKVARFDPVTGAFVGDFVASPAGGLSLPIDLAFGPNGDLYVASFNNSLVARFNGGSGAFVSNFVASASGGLAGPNFMTFRAARTYGTNVAGLGPVGPIEQRHLGLLFTEGPAADANGHIYFTDVQGNRVYRSDTRGLLSVFLPASSACNGLMFDQSGRLVACQRDQRRLIAIDVTTTNVTPLATNFAGRAFIGPNDIVIDSTGGAYFSDPNFASGQTGSTQSVYYVTAAGIVSQVISNLSRPNGVLLSPDETKLYVVLSGSATLLTYSLSAPGALGPPVTTALPGTGDGMTLDTAGNLYLCQPSQNRLLVLSPAGTTRGFIPIPEAPANCTFGGKDMKTLYVTARTSVYVCRMAATGHRFAWNPGSYADFHRKFFGGTNAPSAARALDADADGASNELEYLTRTHPLCFGDAWRVTVRRAGSDALLEFQQAAGRGYDLEFSSAVGASANWQSLNVPGNPPAISTTNRTAVIQDAVNPATNRFYRARVFEP